MMPAPTTATRSIDPPAMDGSPPVALSETLDRDARPGPAVAADRRKPVAAAERLQLPDEVQQNPGARHADGMPERDRAPPDVDPPGLQVQVPQAGEHLGRKGFVDLHEVELPHLHPELAEELPRGSHRGDRVVL